MNSIGPTHTGQGSTGARLSCKALEQIFDWVELRSCRKALRAANSTDADPVYLQFPPDGIYAKAYLNGHGIETFFDVFPAYAPTSSTYGTMLYVLRHVHDASITKPIRRWVLWDVARRRVTLTESLHEFCFPRLVTPRRSSRDMLWIVLPRPDDGEHESIQDLVQLHIDLKGNKSLDLGMRELDLSRVGVSFSTHLVGRRLVSVHY